MKYVILEHHPNDSRLKIVHDGICQTLSQWMGTGGNNVPLVLIINENDEEQNNICLRCSWKRNWGVAPTITGDHQNRITDYTAIALEIHGKNIDNSKRSGGGRRPN